MSNLTRRYPFSPPAWGSQRLSALTVALCLTGAALPLVGHATEPATPEQWEMPGVSRDTLRHLKPRLFERRVVFSPEYLTRILAAATRGEEERTAEEENARLAGVYAARYEITGALALQIVQSAVAEGVDPELAFRLVRTESVFRPNARGPQGALGLTQLMPRTARALDRSLQTESQILDPATNLRTGFRYLRMMIEKYNGDVRLGLLAYNRGEGTVDRALRRGQDPENGYSERVLGRGGDRYVGAGVVR